MQPGRDVQFFIDGNVDVKARDLVNETGLAGNLQFYGISPDRWIVPTYQHQFAAGDLVAYVLCPERETLP